MFGIHYVSTDEDILWFEGPGDMLQSVNKHNPRVWFDDAADAHQAGSKAILVVTEADAEAWQKAIASESESPDADSPDTGFGGGADTPA